MQFLFFFILIIMDITEILLIRPNLIIQGDSKKSRKFCAVNCQKAMRCAFFFFTRVDIFPLCVWKSPACTAGILAHIKVNIAKITKNDESHMKTKRKMSSLSTLGRIASTIICIMHFFYLLK